MYSKRDIMVPGVKFRTLIVKFKWLQVIHIRSFRVVDVLWCASQGIDVVTWAELAFLSVSVATCSGFITSGVFFPSFHYTIYFFFPLRRMMYYPSSFPRGWDTCGSAKTTTIYLAMTNAPSSPSGLTLHNAHPAIFDMADRHRLFAMAM